MKKVTIIGCGPGAVEAMTKQAESYIEQAEALIGAARMIEPYQEKKECFACYEKEKIKNYIDTSEKESFAVLMSGDSGFYSGTHGLLELLQEDYRVKVIPGISSLSYMASKIGRAWENVSVLSIHGRAANAAETVRRNRETFLLTGGNAAFICRELTAAGYGNLIAYIGERLSYPEEKILKLRLEEAQYREFDKLAVLWIVNENKNASYHFGIEDKYFIRGSAPMTKSEVRAISLSKLRLAREAVAWDIGCGTGSVTVEMALCADRGRVFAVDKSEEAAELTRQNIKKFGIENVSVIQAGAAEVIGELPIPDAVFIGGSKGELEPVIKEAVRKNPRVRIVCNMIVLENITEVLQLLKSNNLDDVEVVQAAISYSAKAGDAHMMLGQNPVYIISAGGDSQWQGV